MLDARYVHTPIQRIFLYYFPNARQYILSIMTTDAPHFRVNFWPDIAGAAPVDLELDLPQTAQAFALYAHFWQYVRPWSTLVLQVVQELEYAAYGFLAALESSLLFPMPFWPRVAELFVLSPPFDPEPAGDP